MKGLSADGAGANGFIHLGLVEVPHTDPHFWTLVQTVRMTRDCGIPDVVLPALWALTTGDAFPANGITATLMTRLHCLGWHFDSSHMLHDDFGSFGLFEVSFEELRWRMEWAWLKVVSSQVSHRPGLRDLDLVDPSRTRNFLAQLSPMDSGAYRRLLNGTHLTQDAKFHCQEADDDRCPYCECSDSRYHRFWLCPVLCPCFPPFH